MPGHEFERLAFEAAQRSLDKQERLLEELRARTGILLAASALAASFLGQQAFREPDIGLVTVVALAAFVLSMIASAYILLPKTAVRFAESGVALYDGLYSLRDDLTEVHRQLAYDLDRFWNVNNETVRRLTGAYRLAVGAVTVETLALATLLGGRIY